MKIKDRLRSAKVIHECYIETVWYVDITDYVIEIFGGIIKKVEVTLYYDEDNIEEAEIEADNYIDDIKKENSIRNAIDFDARYMLITFINGKQIEIWNSEWGGIKVPYVQKGE